jgi:hypothetical protein
MQATFNGGRTVIDYRVSYDQGTGDFVVLADGITAYYFTTETVLTPGVTYSFKVEARNSAGYSSPSDPLSVLAAQLADAPLQPTTVTD